MRKRDIQLAPGAAAGKQRILRAALRLFTEKGLCETSIRDIGAAARAFESCALQALREQGSAGPGVVRRPAIGGSTRPSRE